MPPYSAMSDAIYAYVTNCRECGLDHQQVAMAVENALASALGTHFIVDVSIAWRKGKGETE